MNKRDGILRALLTKYQGERDALACNLDIYIGTPISIPEHVDFIQYVDQIIAQISELDDKIELTTDLLKTVSQHDSE